VEEGGEEVETVRATCGKWLKIPGQKLTKGRFAKGGSKYTAKKGWRPRLQRQRLCGISSKIEPWGGLIRARGESTSTLKKHKNDTSGTLGGTLSKKA